MRRCVFLLVVILLVISCKGGQKSNQTSATSVTDTINVDNTLRGPFTIHIDDKTVPLYETFRLGELIESVRYIPLEATVESYLANPGDIHYNNECFYVTYSKDIFSTNVKAFDKQGHYLYEMYTIGRGPNEVINPGPYMIYNDATNKFVVSAYHEFLIVDEVTRKKQKVRYESLDQTLDEIVALSNGTYVSMSLYCDQITDPKLEAGSYLIFYDSLFNVIGSLADNREHKHKVIDNVTTIPVLKSLLTQSGDRVLYKELDSDTIYAVNADMTLTPEIIIDIPDKLKPTIRESIYDSKEKKQKKIYLYDFYETKDYIILRYDYDGGMRIGWWSKESGELVYCLSTPYLFGKYGTITYDINGIRGNERIYNLNASNNIIYLFASPSQLKDELPGITIDDNPVIVEITLRSGIK